MLFEGAKICHFFLRRRARTTCELAVDAWRRHVSADEGITRCGFSDEYPVLQGGPL